MHRHLLFFPVAAILALGISISAYGLDIEFADDGTPMDNAPENGTIEEFSPYISFDELQDLTPTEILAEAKKPIQAPIGEEQAEIGTVDEPDLEIASRKVAGKAENEMSADEREAARYIWEDQLFRKAYILESFNGEPIESPRPITLLFDDEGGVIGRICNTFSGKGEYANMFIKVTDAVTTRMMCPDEKLAKLENEFLRNIAMGMSYQINDDELELRRDSMVLIYRIDDNPMESNAAAPSPRSPAPTPAPTPPAPTPVQEPVRAEPAPKPTVSAPVTVAPAPAAPVAVAPAAAPIAPVEVAVAPVPAAPVAVAPAPVEPKPVAPVAPVVPAPKPTAPAPAPQAVTPVTPPVAVTPPPASIAPPASITPPAPAPASVAPPVSVVPSAPAATTPPASVAPPAPVAPPTAMSLTPPAVSTQPVRPESGGSSVSQVSEGELIGHMFVLAKIDGEDFSPDMGEQPFIQFEQGMLITGKACNNFRGKGELEGDVLTVAHAASTMMMCVDAKLNQYESDFHRLIREGAKVEVGGKRLILSGGGKEFTYFEP